MDEAYLRTAIEAAILTDPTIAKPAATSDQTALYRHFNKRGVLLYVGISIEALRRTQQHRRKAPWFTSVARIDIEWFDTRRKAEAAEQRAIYRERPIHNTAFNAIRQAIKSH